jgi:hypothetical protein
MKRLAGALGVLWLAACSAGGPRQAPEPLLPTPWVAPPRVYSLIGERERLGLNSAQVTALDSLGVAHQETNTPLIDRVRELRGENTGRPRTDPQTNSLVRPLLEQIRDNNQRALGRVQTILTDEQERKVCDLNARERREEERQREREGRDRRFRGRGSGMRADTVQMAAAGGWPWCRALPAARDTTRTRKP